MRRTDVSTDYFFTILIGIVCLLVVTLLVGHFVYMASTQYGRCKTCAEAVKVCAGSRGIMCEEVDRLCETRQP